MPLPDCGWSRLHLVLVAQQRREVLLPRLHYALGCRIIVRQTRLGHSTLRVVLAMDRWVNYPAMNGGACPYWGGPVEPSAC